MKYPKTAGLAVSAAAAMAIAGPATAAPVPTTVNIIGGKTTLKAAKAPKKVKVTGGKFTITGGDVVPSTLSGDLSHTGKLTIKKGRKSVKLFNPNIGDGRLIVKAGKKTLTLATLSGGSRAVDGYDPTAKGIKAKLTKAAAKALNKALGGKKFKKGRLLGKLGIRAVAGQALVAGGTSTLPVDEDVKRRLAEQGASISPAAPATTDAQGAFVLPVTGGVVGLVAGQETIIGHAGGITVTKDYSVLATLEGLSWEIGGERDALQVGSPIPLPFGDITGAQTVLDADNKTASGSNLALTLSDEAGQALGVFNLSLPPKQPLGVGSYQVTLK